MAGIEAEPVRPATPPALRALLAGVRVHGPALLARADDPHAELLALVWGSRLDREHARALLDGEGPATPGLWQGVMAAADSFDRLSLPRQHRLRRLILRDRARRAGDGTIALHAPHPAD